MSACQECGRPTALDYPLCRTCFTQHTTGTDTAQKGPVRPSVLSDRSPLDVYCDRCGAEEGEHCGMDEYEMRQYTRVVELQTWRIEVHEARFRTWRSPVIT
jgi:hypothetical protein